jgi:hypothetical protein
LSTRLADCWTSPLSSITEARLLLVLGASPAPLYADDSFGKRTLARRELEGSVCAVCAEKYREFLALAQRIHDAQFRRDRVCALVICKIFIFL